MSKIVHVVFNTDHQEAYDGPAELRGIWSTREEAEAYIENSGRPDSFYIEEYLIGRDHHCY